MNYSDWYGLPSIKYPDITLAYFSLDHLNKNVRTPFDPGIKNTVATFILNYLSGNPDNVLFYVISAAGDKERQRRIAFDRWFTSSKEKPDFIEKTIQQLENQEIHFLYRKDRPNVATLVNDIEIYSLLPDHLLR